MFSSAPNVFGDEPNTNVNEVDLGMPGVLPVVNKTAVESSIKIGLALNCKIAETCRFARKNYFYPDTPKNFQTSQYDEPIAYDGYLDIELADGTVFRVEIERAHMEEDAGKLTHMGGATGRIQGADYSLVDYNRSGVPLVEIVTKPIEGAGSRAPELAKAYVAAVREIVKNLGVSDAKMERGNVRCDANVSLRPHGREKLRHPLRDQERELAARRRTRRPLRDPAARRRAGLRRAGHPGNPALARGHPDHHVGPAQVRRRRLPLLPGAGPGALVALARMGRGAAVPRCPSRRPSAASGCRPTGATRTWSSATSSTPASWTRSRKPSPPAPPPPWPASGGWARSSAAPRTADVDPGRAGRQPGHRRGTGHAGRGRQDQQQDGPEVLDGVLAGEGTPAEIVEKRGLAVVSDDGALLDAIDAALAAQPDVAEKIRGGKVQAVGAIVGGVMKVTRGPGRRRPRPRTDPADARRRRLASRAGRRRRVPGGDGCRAGILARGG